VGQLGAPQAAAIPGGQVRSRPVGHVRQHARQDQDLDARHELAHLAAAVVELVAVVVAGVSSVGDNRQQVDELGHLRT
jgi:hypothetical protein